MGTMDRLFQLMADKKASDLYISVGSPIHIKIMGMTVPVNQQVMEAGNISALLKELASESQYRQFEETLELNTAYALPGVGNFRISAMWQKGSPAFVARYIPTDVPAFDTLGLPPLLKESIMEKRGLILMVGATGSGKTTTLTAMLDYRNETTAGHILTLEDPIEFIFKNKKSIVNQRELGVDTHDYATALRNALRQAPDCIFIGEIRDKETMAQALAYAQSGHLCLATLHANNSYHSLSRIISFYPLENRPALLADLSVALRLIISQRLLLTKEGTRVPAVEIMLNSRHVSDMIEKGDLVGIKESMEQSMTPGAQTFEQSLYTLYKDGVITMDEALSNADSANNLQWLINNAAVESKTQKQAPDTTLQGETDESGATFSEFTLTVG